MAFNINEFKSQLVGGGARSSLFQVQILNPVAPEADFKVPFMVDLGIINIDSMSVSWWMFIPAVLGAAIAPFIVKFINQKLFESLVWIFIVIAGVRMLF